jgi:DNA processing protein
MMSSATGDGACRACLRRSWLLAKLSMRLDYRSRDENRLLQLLALEDEELIRTLGGRWRRRLRAEWERFEPDESGSACGAHGDIEAVCTHNAGYPRGLRGRGGAPRMLYVAGGARQLATLAAEPTVAIVGSIRPTDYGMEMAGSLARGLTASGVTVVSGLANGIAAAAHAGALEADGPTVTVMAGGVDVIAPAGRRELYERVVEHGCAVAEPPCGYRQRRWCGPARARVIAGLAWMTIVVEAGESPSELRIARVARSLGRIVAAVPGRVTSPASQGTNALLMAGAPLLRGPADALDLLYGVGGVGARGSGASRADAHGPIASEGTSTEPGASGPSSSSVRMSASADSTPLEPRLRTVLEQVGAGRDTPGKLTSAGGDFSEMMLALSELEIMGLLGRGDGGRYVPRESLAGR